MKSLKVKCLLQNGSHVATNESVAHRKRRKLPQIPAGKERELNK